MSRIIRESQPSDMADIMTVMDAAKGIMRQSGNKYQWGDDYPSEAVITADMEKGGGFVVVDDDKVVVQHLITKHGFIYCGIIYLASGDERLAYQKTMVSTNRLLNR